MPDYDIFVSYSWSEDPAGPRGDGWANEFRMALERDLEEPLGRRPRIFLDQTGMRNGPVADTLRLELERATAFIAVVSDAWTRPNSWCRWELAHFRACARLHPEPPDNRISKVLLAPLAPGTELPGELAQSPGYIFYSLTGREHTGRPNTFAVSELAKDADYRRLITNLTKTLTGADEHQSKQDLTVYVAEVPPTPEWQARRDRLCMDLRRNRIRPLCEIRWPGADDARFKEQIGMRMAQTHASVHLLGAFAAGQAAAQAEFEFDKALEVSERDDRQPLRILFWSDDKESAPPQWRPFIEKARNLPGVDNFLGKSWEYLLSNILDGIHRRRVPTAPGLSDTPGSGALVFAPCLEEDLPFARAIREILSAKGHQVDFLPPPDGYTLRMVLNRPKLEDKAWHKTYVECYQRSDGLLIIYGNGKSGEFWSRYNCNDIRSCLKEELRGKVRGVCLVPPEEKKDFQDFVDPSFQNYFFSRLDDFEKKLPRKGYSDPASGKSA